MPGNLPLTDRLMPFPDATERHSILIPASRDQIWHAIKHPNPTDIRLARPLFAIRDLASRLRNGHAQRDLPNFITLAEDPGREVVDGVIGQWWRLGRAENVSSVTGPDDFLAFDRPGFAKATFSFLLEDVGDGRIRLITETRIQATSPAARQAFLRYWLLIRLGSGFVRRVMLSAIRARALKIPPPVPDTNARKPGG
ncbi:hypothetical protein DP939_27435 [Spongiactinospora rosea]|uniref:DUF2867 domain-containing protein n=1 Tax=Spongiactinospora rosea TaxID=2248750 RepID=A0A366LSB8_9ACTN|nr:hypothetical protein [Spongiactinospora rosea]RBQ16808.1 hypothetical protein DP939_27435 [Spongiactinospora rosea]